MNYAMLLVLAGVLLLTQATQDDIEEHYAERSSDEFYVMAANMQFYHHTLTLYAERNKSIVGAPSDAALSLPSWYIKQPSIVGYVDSGAAFTACVGCSQAVLGRLMQLTKDSCLVGTVESNGSMRSKILGTLMSFPVSSSFPVGSVVYLSKGY
ncbi:MULTISPECIES: type IV pilus biogenesis protein PilM [Aeromonas]|nr:MULTISPECIES: type IV pilus biogenesis protein PilM [Aeromonas]